MKSLLLLLILVVVAPLAAFAGIAWRDATVADIERPRRVTVECACVRVGEHCAAVRAVELTPAEEELP